MTRIKSKVLATALCCLVSACAHPAPALHDRTRVISGRSTAGETAREAAHKVFAVGAAIALDHGYRYFEVLEPIRPGNDVTIRVYGAGEIDPHTAGVWDANAIAEGQFPPGAEPPPADSTAP